jgi:cytochrome c oxidase subunit 2
VLIAILVVVFAIKFHRKHDQEVGEAIHGSLALELIWTIIPLGITMVMFVWGAQVFFHMTRAPKGAMEIYVVGKQWMWKAQHVDGARGSTSCTCRSAPGQADHGSEDVIHSFFIPDFRVKADVVRAHNTMWFTASKPGKHTSSARNCGTNTET